MSMLQASRSTPIFDPHIHLFNLQQGEYTWLKPEKPPFWPDKDRIYQNFSLHDLQLQSPLSIVGVCHIEAGFDNLNPERELRWLENEVIHQNTSKLVMASAAFVDMQQDSNMFIEVITRLRKHISLCAIRHIFEDDTIELCENPKVIANLHTLHKHGLHFELQFDMANKAYVNAIITLLTAANFPKVVLTHAGFAEPSNAAVFSQWKEHCLQLSRIENTYIKCSGFELVNRQYSKQHMQDVITACVQFFGEDRVMCASNFPLCLFSVSYQQYWLNMVHVLKALSLSTHKLCYQNAATLYCRETR